MVYFMRARGRARAKGENQMLKSVIKAAVVVVLLALLLVLAPSPMSTYDAFAEVVDLPMDSSGGLEYSWSNYLSDSAYEDPSLRVDIYRGGRIHDTNYMYAIAKIVNPTQLRTAMAYKYNSDYTIPGHKMAQANNAVLAINGDYFNYYKHGYLVRHADLFRNRPNKVWDILIIDQRGDFHTIMEPTKDKIDKWKADNPGLTIINSFNFGPVLIDEGIARTNMNSVLNHDYIGTHKLCQRMAFCQLDTLTYLCVTSEGPEDEGSVGLTLDQFVECLLEVDDAIAEYDIRVAYNLDGGSSSTMVFQEKKVNAPTNPKIRYLCDIIYFASAWKE